MDNWIRFAIFLIYPNYGLSQLETIYDFIVVGSGPGGSTVANRLSEIEDWNVILFEAGKEEADWLQVPAFCKYAIDSEFDWGYKSEPESGACLSQKEHRCEWSRGKVLGGSSSINEMLYVRAHREDYNDWAENGNDGWSYDDVLPYFLKTENARIPEFQNSDHHRTGGYLSIERVPYRTKLFDAFMEAAQELGFPVIDYNDGNVSKGVSPLQATLYRGQRHSASKAFLKPVLHRRNLKILMESHVTKILINPETKTAYGVEVLIGDSLQTFIARKEVILSAGPIASPQLLMLSGIGPQYHLYEMGIPVIQDLPVGRSVANHVGYSQLSFSVQQPHTGIVRTELVTQRNLDDFSFEGKGPLTVPGFVEGFAFLHTKWNTDVKNRPDIQVIFLCTSLPTLKNDYLQYVFFGRVTQTWGVHLMLSNTKSRGHILLKSRNPLDHPKLFGNLFQDETDLNTLVEGIKFIIDISQTDAFQKYGSQIVQKSLPGCDHVPFGTDSYWKCAIRYDTTFMHHHSESCKMGPAHDPTAVVSSELKVHGIKNLRVVDSSIFPTLLTGNTLAASYMVGEKGSNLIKSSWEY